MYRKIKVGNQTYEYIVGKTHVKIRGIGAFLKSDVGQMTKIEDFCDCCGEPLTSLYSWHKNRTAVAVKPSDIARLIRKTLPQTPEDTYKALIAK